jgi:tetratricopeptide (TPR) repeat protein
MGVGMSDLHELTDFFPRPSQLIGRDQELNALRAALDNIQTPARLYYFYGDGGIGKTALLEALERMVSAQRAAGEQILDTGLIDLQELRYNQPVLFLRTLSRRVLRSLTTAGHPNEQAFAAFEKAATNYQDLYGSSEQVNVEQRYQDVEAAFISAYTTIAQTHRIVIMIDTFERVDAQLPEMAEFDFRNTPRFDQRIVTLCAQLPNTLVAIAGRERPLQLDWIKANFATQLHLRPITLLTDEQTREFVRQSVPEHADWSEALYAITKGRPITLLIAIACIKAGLIDQTIIDLAQNHDDTAIHQQLRTALLMLLNREIATQQPDWLYIFQRIVYLRKGFSRELLQRLPADDYPGMNLDQAFERFRMLPIVKRIGDTVIALHDELYDLLFDQLGGAGDTNTWYDYAIEHLDEQIKAAREKDQRSDPNPFHQSLLQALNVQRIYYKLCRDPISGYQDYCEILLSAIRTHAHDFDAMLVNEFVQFYDPRTNFGKHQRNQLALHGFSWEKLLFEEAVRWVYRCKFSVVPGRDRYEYALYLSQRIRERFVDLLGVDHFAEYELRTAELESKPFHPDYQDRAAELSQEFADLIDEMELFASLFVKDEPSANFVPARLHLLFATVHANYGYHERLQQHYTKAAQAYREALTQMRDLGPEAELMRALTLNNYGYVLALQGNPERGMRLIDQVIRLYRQYGVQHSVGIALNTKSRILLQMNRPEEALEVVKQARDILEKVDSKRNLALCSHSEGNILRWLAYKHREDIEQSETQYLASITCYEQAIEQLSSAGSGELIRQIEFRKSLGCAYRSRGFARFQRDPSAGWETDMEQARQDLQVALELCPPDWEAKQIQPIVAELLEDIAVSYINADKPLDALPYLERARNAIPEIYQIEQGSGLNNTPATRDQRIFWLRLGQVELQFGMCSILGETPAKRDEWGTYMLRAFACIQFYSAQAPQLEALRAISRREMERIGNRAELERLRRAVYWQARLLKLADTAFPLFAAVFDEVIDDLDLGIVPSREHG